LAKEGSETPFVVPEPACGIPGGIIRIVIREWMSIKHLNTGSL
jgi:hypothetical protein